MTVSGAFGSARGLLRIYNLTGEEVRITTDATGLEDNSTKERELTGKVAPDSAFPDDHAAFFIDDNLFRSTDVTIQATSGRGSAEITLHAKDSRFIQESRKERGLRITSVIAPPFAMIGLGQTLISIYISDREVDGASWMSQLRDDVRLSDLLIPGAHAVSAFPKNKTIIGSTQRLSPPEQLDVGIRYFDLRGRPVSDTSIKAVHLKTDLYAMWDDFFDDCIRFLKQHPEEALLVQLHQDSGDPAQFQAALEHLLAKRTLQPYLYEGPWRRSNGTKRLTLPRLGDARGKIVLLNRVSDYFTKNYDSMRFSVVEGWGPYNPDAGHFAVQDTYDNPRTPTKVDLVTKFFEATKKNSLLNLNFTSAIGGFVGIETIGTYAGTVGLVPQTFLLRAKNPAAYDAVVPMDLVQRNDTRVRSLYLLNLLPDQAESEEPIVGQSYYFRPKTVADKVLTLDAALQNVAAVHARYTGKLESRPGQEFLLGDTPATAGTPDPDYTLTTRSRENAPLYLTEGGPVLSGSPQDAGDSSIWIIEPVADSPYVRLRNAASGLYATLRGGEVKDDTGVFLAPLADDQKGDDRQLWIADRVKARRTSR